MLSALLKLSLEAMVAWKETRWRRMLWFMCGGRRMLWLAGSVHGQQFIEGREHDETKLWPTGRVFFVWTPAGKLNGRWRAGEKAHWFAWVGRTYVEETSKARKAWKPTNTSLTCKIPLILRWISYHDFSVWTYGTIPRQFSLTCTIPLILRWICNVSSR